MTVKQEDPIDSGEFELFSKKHNIRQNNGIEEFENNQLDVTKSEKFKYHEPCIKKNASNPLDKQQSIENQFKTSITSNSILLKIKLFKYQHKFSHVQFVVILKVILPYVTPDEVIFNGYRN